MELQTHQEMALLADQRSGRKVMGYRYGIPALDRLVIGVVPSELTVLGGRPEQGKSSLIAQLVFDPLSPRYSGSRLQLRDARRPISSPTVGHRLGSAIQSGA